MRNGKECPEAHERKVSLKNADLCGGLKGTENSKQEADIKDFFLIF